MSRIERIRFDWQIGLIGLSALVGLLVAYNRKLAVFQFAIIIIAIVAYLIMANIPDPVAIRGQPQSSIAAITALLPAVLAMVLLVTNDWARWIGKVPTLDPILRLLAGWLPGMADLVNPNVIGGLLAALLPLQVFALRRTRRAISLPLIALTLIALILSQTRGAWLTLLLALGMWVMWKAITGRVTDVGRARRLWMAGVAGCGALMIGILTVTPVGDRLLDLGGDRRAIWHNSVDLVSDYPVTGLGLAGFEMAYSTYSLLIHVGHTVHAHNLWLDIWLNQGIIGVIALAGMVLNAVWPKEPSPWRMPALLALSVILMHSLIDDPYYGALPVVFIPLGLLIRSDPAPATQSPAKRSKLQPALAMWAGAGILLGAGLLTSWGRAIVEANLGALAQTQAELSQYSWPKIPIQDALRRPGQTDLGTVEARYQTALALDPANATANRRLGQIELAREQVAAACDHLNAAYQTAPQQRATRQMLGECDAIAGLPEAAAALWKTIDVGQRQLDIRRWWYDEYLHDHGRADQLQLAINLLARE